MILVKQFNPKNPKSLALRTHCQTSGWSLTEQDPFNNVSRTCIEAMGAALGHTQSLHTNALDEAIALPTDFSARIARNTQLYIQEETNICRTVDPWAGSFYVESLTHEIAHRAWKLIEEVEKLGGMAKAIETGIPKMRIEEAAARRQAQIDSGNDTIVGVNKYRLDHEAPIDTLEVDNTTVREAQIARLKKLRSERNNEAVQAALDAITECARTGKGNLLALSINAARLRASLGEISMAMEKVFGRYKAKINLISGVYSSITKDNNSFNQACKMADQFAEKEGRRPRIMIAKMGQVTIELVGCGLIILGEIGVYGEWENKLSYKILLYLQRPMEIITTATTMQLIGGVAGMIFFVAGGLCLCRRAIWKTDIKLKKRPCIKSVATLLLSGGLCFLGMRGGLDAIPITQSAAYYSHHDILNDAAVNPHWNLLYSIVKGAVLPFMSIDSSGLNIMFFLGSTFKIKYFNAPKPTMLDNSAISASEKSSVLPNWRVFSSAISTMLCIKSSASTTVPSLDFIFPLGSSTIPYER